MPGQVGRDDRDARGDRLAQLLGRRVAVVERRRLDRHHHDVRRRGPVEELRPAGRASSTDPAAVRRLLDLRRQVLRQCAEPEQHEHGVRDLEDRVHRLLDAALGHQLPLVEDDGRAGGEPEGRADEVGPRLGGVQISGQFMTTGGRGDAEPAGDQVRVRLVDGQHGVGGAAPSGARAARGWRLGGARSARSRATACTRRGCRRSSARRAAAASARAPAATRPTCRARCRRARRRPSSADRPAERPQRERRGQSPPSPGSAEDPSAHSSGELAWDGHDSLADAPGCAVLRVDAVVSVVARPIVVGVGPARRLAGVFGRGTGHGRGGAFASPAAQAGDHQLPIPRNADQAIPVALLDGRQVRLPARVHGHAVAGGDGRSRHAERPGVVDTGREGQVRDPRAGPPAVRCVSRRRGGTGPLHRRCRRIGRRSGSPRGIGRDVPTDLHPGSCLLVHGGHSSGGRDLCLTPCHRWLRCGSGRPDASDGQAPPAEGGRWHSALSCLHARPAQPTRRLGARPRSRLVGSPARDRRPGGAHRRAGDARGHDRELLRPELAGMMDSVGIRGAMHPAGLFYTTATIRQELERLTGGWPERAAEPTWVGPRRRRRPVPRLRHDLRRRGRPRRLARRPPMPRRTRSSRGPASSSSPSGSSRRGGVRRPATRIGRSRTPPCSTDSRRSSIG